MNSQMQLIVSEVSSLSSRVTVESAERGIETKEAQCCRFGRIVSQHIGSPVTQPIHNTAGVGELRTRRGPSSHRMVTEPLMGWESGAAPAKWTPSLPPSWTQTPHGRQLSTLVSADETVSVEGATLPAAACRSERRSIEPMSAVLYIAGTSGMDAREHMLGNARGSAPLRVTEQEDAAELIDIGVGDRGDIATGEGTWELRCHSASGLLADDGGRATTGGSAASVGLTVLEDCGGETGEVGKDESKSTCVGDIGLKGMNTLD
ncbi:predicted protein [Postia placenta Mad-698-R]|uniref:Uncharacterized protein n=1 Tax=Postia placenta MAD-698-R-SB12 TaxID=670580 RepID=A0A1X6MID2_9APHY|nr:hypothetical protein POSPLADRAFT_1160988 [Postia placenta MAD-698-R-SB12]EED80782.1 predicted protein [Postia placenta Mad-698-R]OSX56110.1 hypothetical protein POSPLADRAFT_1160988 [Postia placenta MAD-698-R-SB12]